jgi:hypothetical protein
VESSTIVLLEFFKERMNPKHGCSLIAYYLIILVAVISFSCGDNAPDDNPISEDVPGLTSFQFLASENPELFQDIIFIKQPDNSFAASVVHEVSLSGKRASFDYSGNAEMNGSVIVSGETSFSFPDEFIIKFDGKRVMFRINRFYAIPTLYINTENSQPITSKTEYVKCSMRINGKNMFEDFATIAANPAEIRGRGNSTWNYYNKKPYRIKLDSKASLLGMGSGKSWVLLANYRDPSNFMNAVTFDMARFMDMPYTNNNRFVEVYLNNSYIGMYQLTEQIQQGDKRVDIDEINGVLLNLDLDDGPYYSPGTGDNFNSSVYDLPVSIKHPEEITSAQVEAIKTDFAQLEQFIKNRDMNSLAQRLDIKSMIDFLIIQEMTRNVELVTPRSMYMYKDVDGIYHFGPVWDFDGGFAFDWASMSNGHGYFGSQSWLMGKTNPATHPNTAYNFISGFFVNLFGNAQFLAAYKARWNELKPGMLNYCFNRLDDYALHCDSAMANNAKRWPIGKDYDTEIDKLRSWLTTRSDTYSAILENY